MDDKAKKSEVLKEKVYNWAIKIMVRLEKVFIKLYLKKIIRLKSLLGAQEQIIMSFILERRLRMRLERFMRLLRVRFIMPRRRKSIKCWMI